MDEQKQGAIEKLRALPEFKRKIIFFAVMAVFVIAFIILGVFATKYDMAKLNQSIQGASLPSMN